MSVAHDVEALLARIGSPSKLRLPRSEDVSPPLVLSWAALNEVLPDGGLPRGVVEFAAPRALGGSTSIALAAVRAGQARGAKAWCAWIDPEGTLHAPGVVAAGVDLSRMLVVHPPRALVGRVALKVVGAGAFEVVVVDFDALPGAQQSPAQVSEATAGKKKGWAPEVLVRKLALAAEPSATTVLLLTDATGSRAVPWPVAMRLELSRPRKRELVVRVAKDKRGRVGVAKTVPFHLAIRATG
jgi:RecA/RadA recombinase